MREKSPASQSSSGSIAATKNTIPLYQATIVGSIAPSPEPALPDPSVTFDAFVPPSFTDLNELNSPGISEYTRTGNVGDGIILTGDFPAGTSFWSYGQTSSTNAVSALATVLSTGSLEAGLTLPTVLPAHAMYLVWPVNSQSQRGHLYAVNRTETWWIGPSAPTRLDTASVYGRNLSYQSGAAQDSAYIYIKAQGSTALGQWLVPTAVNPYKVDFTVPATLANGSYEVWVHNGHGGHYGWSGPQILQVSDPLPWNSNSPIFNVKSYGALGDGVTDDTAAILSAFAAANDQSLFVQEPGPILYFPTGTYMVSQPLNVSSAADPSHPTFGPAGWVKWLGDGPQLSIIRLNAQFHTTNKNTSLLSCDYPWTSGPLEFNNLTFDTNNVFAGAWGANKFISIRNFGSVVRFINVNINALGETPLDLEGVPDVIIENSNITGAGVNIEWIQNQVHIDSTNFYGTDDATSLMSILGVTGISVTNSTGQDANPANSEGASKGRFFWAYANGGSLSNAYIANNSTFNMAPRPLVNGYGPDQNSGEQILFEMDTNHYGGFPTAANATQFVLGNVASGTGQQGETAIIAGGKGLGQHRSITAFDAASQTYTVDSAWNVIPDTTSLIVISNPLDHAVVYQNSLQGKPDWATRYTASSGIELYGDVLDLVADGNTISQVRQAIDLFAMGDANTLNGAPVFFNLFINNKGTDDNIFGYTACGVTTTQGSQGQVGLLGNVFRNNTASGIGAAGFSVYSNPSAGSSIEYNLMQNNSLTDEPVAIDDLTGQNVTGLVQNNIFISNIFNAGISASTATELNSEIGATWIFSGNQFLNFPNLGINISGITKVPEQ